MCTRFTVPRTWQCKVWPALQASCHSAKVAAAAFEAAQVLAGFLARPACPQKLIAQQHLALCQLLQAQVQCNLLAFCDATVRRQHRSDWESLPLAKCALCAASFTAAMRPMRFVQRWR